MRRRLYIFGGVLAIAIGLLCTATLFRPTRANPAKQDAKEPVAIKVIPYGPTQAEIAAASDAVTRSAEVQKYLSGTNHRLLSFQLMEPDEKGQPSPSPTRFVVNFYDYTNNRVVIAEGLYRGAVVDRVSVAHYQPEPSDEEYDLAVRAVKEDKQFSAALRSNALKTYRPMPPVISDENSNGRGNRIVTVGLMGDTGGSLQNEIVGVNLSEGGTVMRFANNAPPSALASPEACGVPNAGQSTTSSGTAGQYQLIVSQGQTELWNLLVIRPSASSGSSKRSGIELRDVKYRGKSVLKRGHVPILNVQYPDGFCGPYRDWQYQEGQFATPAGSTDVAPGIRTCPSPATTSVENGTDTGNFRGVAIYTQNGETVLVTELEAGWYRYIMEWRLGDDGSIHPRFGFGATDNSCVCHVHNHHVYWRLDFDVAGTNNNVFVSEKGKKFLTPLLTEAKVARNYQTNRRLIVQNGSGNEGYILTPGRADGVTDTFGVGDFWVLRYKSSGGNPTELEDGITCVTCSTAYIQIDPFVNGESLANQDVVVWYGAHFIHDDGANLIDPNRGESDNILGTSHVVGPDFVPIQW